MPNVNRRRAYATDEDNRTNHKKAIQKYHKKYYARTELCEYCGTMHNKVYILKHKYTKVHLDKVDEWDKWLSDNF